MTNDLIIPFTITPELFYKDGGVEGALKEAEKAVSSFKGDVSTNKGRKEITAFCTKINNSKSAIEEVGKEIVADWKAKAKIIDAKRKMSKEKFDELKALARKPLTNWENAEKERVQELEECLTRIREKGNDCALRYLDWDIETMKLILEEVESINSRDWQEYNNRAELAYNTSTNSINDAIAKREKHDAEQKELAELKAFRAEKEKQEAEEKIKREAAEKARLEAERQAQIEANRIKEERLLIERKAQVEREKLEREKQQAEEAKLRAEAQLKDAQEKAKREAEEALQRERARVEREKQLEEQEKAKREADKKHRNKINQEIVTACAGLNITDKQCMLLVNAINAGKIPHVKINY